MSDAPIDIEKLFSCLSVKDLMKSQSILKRSLEEAIVNDKKLIHAISANDFVTYSENFVDTNSDTYKGILDDINTSKILENIPKSGKKVCNIWISNITQPYQWKSRTSNKSYSFDPRALINTLPSANCVR